MNEPLAYPLISLTKKYLSFFAKETLALKIDRYHYILMLIDDNHENLTQKAIGDLLHLDKSYMVNIIDYLSSNGYVFREKNPIDRRQQLIRLTDLARKDVPFIKNVYSELNKKSFNNLSRAEIDIFNKVIAVIQDNLADSQPNEIHLEIKKK